ncbi:Tfp pilus assembly protein FimT/FimU [Chloroflexota bacterium]
MQDKAGLGFYFEIVVAVLILGSLAAIAIPHVAELIGKGKVESRGTEFHNIQTAVVEMLSESSSGTLEPVGLTADMSKVRTGDTPPLVLTSYLFGLEGTLVRSGCVYSFSTDGTVLQVTP